MSKPDPKWVQWLDEHPGHTQLIVALVFVLACMAFALFA